MSASNARSFSPTFVTSHAGPISGVPVHSICRASRSWAVVRSRAKALGPDLRVAIVSGDEETTARVEGRQLLAIRWVSHVLQQLVAALWSDAGIKTRMRTAARTYTRRRNGLLEALAEHGIKATGRSGLNVWIPVPEEAVVMRGLHDAGWAVACGERFRFLGPPAIRVTAAALGPADAQRLAEELSKILAPGTRTLRT